MRLLYLIDGILVSKKIFERRQIFGEPIGEPSLKSSKGRNMKLIVPQVAIIKVDRLRDRWGVDEACERAALEYVRETPVTLWKYRELANALRDHVVGKEERVKCPECGSVYSAEWAGTTCSDCDGVIGAPIN